MQRSYLKLFPHAFLILERQSATIDSSRLSATPEGIPEQKLASWSLETPWSFDTLSEYLNLQHLTPFQRTVYASLCAVGTGQTTTYKHLANAVGHPRSARAVGMCMRINPFVVLVPCHRVCKTDGSLGGYSGGLHWKSLLLSTEATL